MYIPTCQIPIALDPSPPYQAGTLVSAIYALQVSGFPAILGPRSSAGFGSPVFRFGVGQEGGEIFHAAEHDAREPGNRAVCMAGIHKP